VRSRPIGLSAVRSRLLLTVLCLALGLSVGGKASAEPYFAVQQGLKCSGCHVNPTGGGMRNTFGQIWGQTALPEKRIDTGEPWTGELSRFLAIGGNLRASGSYTDTPNQPSLTAFDVDKASVYLDVRAIPDRLSLYVDQRVAPGGSINSEAYARLWFGGQRFYVKAGQFFLPFGIRLQDDSAFTRQVTGINFATPDRGAEFGYETASWSAQFAVSNGTAGGPATSNGKQYSLRVEHVTPIWRAGVSTSLDESDDDTDLGGVRIGKRQMHGVFAGLRTGPIAWLAEADYIVDDTLVPNREQAIGLLEANWRVRQGHNLKVTAEYFDPDTDLSNDYRSRFSLVWEYTPIQFAQLRVGFRDSEGIPQSDIQNQRLVFMQVNGYF
jgi:hypothetical protein